MVLSLLLRRRLRQMIERCERWPVSDEIMFSPDGDLSRNLRFARFVELFA